jgi:hypothetical protein
MNKYNKIILLFTANLIIINCGKNKIDDIGKLSLKLQDQGLKIISEETIDISSLTHATIDEAILLRGEKLELEVYRIEDSRTFKLFVGSGVLISIAEQEGGGVSDISKKMWFKEPFIVLIEKEPRKGIVEDALNEILN